MIRRRFFLLFYVFVDFLFMAKWLWLLLFWNYLLWGIFLRRKYWCFWSLLKLHFLRTFASSKKTQIKSKTVPLFVFLYLQAYLIDYFYFLLDFILSNINLNLILQCLFGWIINSEYLFIAIYQFLKNLTSSYCWLNANFLYFHNAGTKNDCQTFVVH